MTARSQKSTDFLRQPSSLLFLRLFRYRFCNDSLFGDGLFATAFFTGTFFTGAFLATAFFAAVFFADAAFVAAGAFFAAFFGLAAGAAFVAAGAFFTAFFGLAAAAVLVLLVALLRAGVSSWPARPSVRRRTPPGQRAGRLAQPLDVVERAPLGQKDMDHKIHVVEQNPIALAAAFH